MRVVFLDNWGCFFGSYVGDILSFVGFGYSVWGYRVLVRAVISRLMLV